MSLPLITHCPGTLSPGFDSYSTTCLRRVFKGKKVKHILPYLSPSSDELTDELFDENRTHMSISGVQEKFSVIQVKNKIRLIEEGEQGTHILKPIPNAGKNPGQMPANENLTMQIARQVYGIETAENALIFFKNGAMAYITRRFDVLEDGSKLAKEDFASLSGRTPQTHGENYKYQGSYLELFVKMKELIPAYRLEAPRLFRQLLFNFLFSNGDAHLKNFALLETPQGDFRLSPAYDLMNTRLHIDDPVFALEEGLLPRKMNQGTILQQFMLLGDQAGLSEQQLEKILGQMISGSNKVDKLVQASYLADSFKRSYLEAYQTRLKKLQKT